MDSPSGRAGLCGSGTQSGAEATPPHTLSHGAKGVQELRLQEKGSEGTAQAVLPLFSGESPHG